MPCCVHRSVGKKLSRLKAFIQSDLDALGQDGKTADGSMMTSPQQYLTLIGLDRHDRGETYSLGQVSLLSQVPIKRTMRTLRTRCNLCTLCFLRILVIEFLVGVSAERDSHTGHVGIVASR